MIRRLASAFTTHRRLAQDGAWSFAGNLFAAMGLFVGVRLLTEVTPREVYGAVALLLGVALLASQILGMPLLDGIARFYPLAARAGRLPALRKTQRRLLLWSIVAAMALMTLVGVGFATPTFPFVAWVAAGIFTAASIALLAEKAFFIAARRQRPAAMVDIFRYWLQPICALGAVLLIGPGVSGILGGQAIGALLVCSLLFFSRTQMEGQDTTQAMDAHYLGEILRYSLPLVVVIPFTWVNYLGDRYIAGHVLGLESVGIYAACFGLITQPFIVTGDAVLQFMRPVFFNAVSDGDRKKARQAMLAWAALALCIFFAGFLATLFLRNIIARVLLAPEYREATRLMPWIAASAALRCLNRLPESLFMAWRKTHWNLITHAIGAVGCVITVWIFTARNGILGTAQAGPVYFGLLLMLDIICAVGAGRAGKRHNQGRAD